MSKRLLSLVLIVFLTILAAFSACGCGVESSALAGNVSQVMQSDNSDEQSDVSANDGEESGTDSAEDFLADVPEYSGFAFCYINGNKPDFAPEEIWTSTQESLDPLDELGRCGTANSCIGRDGMPTEGRGDISDVHPTGWHTDRYDFVEGEALYNRCHLIAHQLSGDDAVPRNLITGTSYMNRDGMLQFEETIGDHVRRTGNHVMYRVTPVFVGDELIARGVHMQAVSVEDNGEGLAFNVFCYNVQPGIDIDYRTGDNKLSEDRTMLEEYQSGKFYRIANTLGVVPSMDGADENAAEQQDAGKNPQTDAETEQAETGDEQESSAITYVLNTNTKKFHYPDCNSVKQMKDKNRRDVKATREEVIQQGYDPCGNCNP